MVELRGDLDLAQEPVGAEGGRELWLEDLECDSALVLEVLSEINGRHPARPEFPLDRVAIGEGGLEAIERFRHGPKLQTATGLRCGLAGRGASRGRETTVFSVHTSARACPVIIGLPRVSTRELAA